MRSASDTRTLTEAGDSALKRDKTASQAPFLFLCFEAHRPLAAPLRISLVDLDELSLGRGASRSYERTANRKAHLCVDDAWMSSRHARLVKVLGRFAVEDLGSKNGTMQNGEAVTRAALKDGDLVEFGRTFFIFREALEVFPDDPPTFEANRQTAVAPLLATLLPSLGVVYQQLGIIAQTNLPILVTGQTGTGKEVTARSIHEISRRTGAFVAVNAGALPEALVEAELFGHRRGAFSDAKEDRPGLVRTADRGTLFLDEIGELRPPAQAALLRVLEEGEVRPVGATAPIKVDVRIVSATNRPLQAMVDAGTFRADLFHRLAGHTTSLWPLEQRREDLGLLITSFLGRHAAGKTAEVTFHPAAVRALFGYGFPGNARELEKVIGAALAFSQGGEIKEAHLPVWARSQNELPAQETSLGKQEDAALREELVKLFREHEGNVSAVARAMGKARMQVQRWMKRFGIEGEAFRK